MPDPDKHPTIVVSVGIVSNNPADVVRAGEVFARAASGLVLEGVNVSVSFGIPTEDNDEAEDTRP